MSAPLERVPLALPPVDSVKFNKADWIIVTEENVEKIFADLKDKKFSMAIFGLTDQGYEELSISIAKKLANITKIRSPRKPKNISENSISK